MPRVLTRKLLRLRQSQSRRPATRPGHPEAARSSSWPGLGGLFGNLGKLGGAGHAKAKAAPPVKANGESGATQVTVYYATDRQYQPEQQLWVAAHRAAPYLTYGSVQVSIPDKRAPGELPLPPGTPSWPATMRKNMC
jgi:hypothetical protein